MTSPSLAGIVLCGGQSTRMGTAKAWLPVGREVMLQRVVRRLQRSVGPVVVVSSSRQSLPALPDDALIAEDELLQQGPLVGLLAGLERLEGRAEAAYVTGCDVPLLHPGWITAIATHLGEAGLAIPDNGQFRHPLAAVYRISIARRVRELIEQGHRRLLDLVDHVATVTIPTEKLREIDPMLDSLRNVNSPADYTALLARIAEHSNDENEPI